MGCQKQVAQSQQCQLNTTWIFPKTKGILNLPVKEALTPFGTTTAAQREGAEAEELVQNLLGYSSMHPHAFVYAHILFESTFL